MLCLMMKEKILFCAIAGECEKDLKVFKGNLKKQGYISEVKSVLSEFAQYGVDFERLDDFMKEVPPEVICIINWMISELYMKNLKSI